MFRLFPEITIGEETFKTVTEVTVSSAWDRFTDMASIILPGKLQKDGETITVGENGIFERGQKAIINLGYYPDKPERFVGYVSDINPDFPIKIDFQDIAWILKQTQVKLSFTKVTLKELIEESLNQAKASITNPQHLADIEAMELNVIDATLGSFRTVGGSVNFVGILNEIKRVYGLVSFFQDGKMFVGAPYAFDGRPIVEHEIIFERNVIEHSLVYVKIDDVRIKVKATSMLPNNTKLEATVGDADGDQRSFFIYNITSLDELKKIATREIDKFKYEGFRGTFTTFLMPRIRHGDRVTLNNKRLPERDGTYQVDDVQTVFGFSGGRQIVKLGPKI